MVLLCHPAAAKPLRVSDRDCGGTGQFPSGLYVCADVLHICTTTSLRHTHVQPTVMFTPVAYTLATEEAERVGVDHVARSSVAGTTLTSAGI